MDKNEKDELEWYRLGEKITPIVAENVRTQLAGDAVYEEWKLFLTVGGRIVAIFLVLAAFAGFVGYQNFLKPFNDMTAEATQKFKKVEQLELKMVQLKLDQQRAKKSYRDERRRLEIARIALEERYSKIAVDSAERNEKLYNLILNLTDLFNDSTPEASSIDNEKYRAVQSQLNLIKPEILRDIRRAAFANYPFNIYDSAQEYKKPMQYLRDRGFPIVLREIDSPEFIEPENRAYSIGLGREMPLEEIKQFLHFMQDEMENRIVQLHAGSDMRGSVSTVDFKNEFATRDDPPTIDKTSRMIKAVFRAKSQEEFVNIFER